MVRTLALTLALLVSAAAVGAEEEDWARTGPYIGAGGVLGVDNFVNLRDDANANLQRRRSCGPILTQNCVHRPLGPAQVDLKETGGLNGYIGYRVHPFLAVEGEVEWMAINGWKSEQRMRGAGIARSIDLDIDTLVITGNLKPYFMTGRIQPFALVGAGLMWEEFGVEYDGFNDDEHHHDFAMRFGGGAEYYATRNVVLSIKASYVLGFGTVKDRDYVSTGMLGLTYRF